MIAEETFVSLEKLSRAAADASLRARGGHVADDLFDSLAVHLLGVGIRAFRGYDPGKAGGVAPETHAYRSMRGWRHSGGFSEGPYIDWLRSNVRDARFEPEGSTSVTWSGELPEVMVEEDEGFAAEVEALGRSLSRSARWALCEVARRMAEHDMTLEEAAVGAGVEVGFARALMDTLRDELRPGSGSRVVRDAGSEEVPVPAWAMVAA